MRSTDETRRRRIERQAMAGCMESQALMDQMTEAGRWPGRHPERIHRAWMWCHIAGAETLQGDHPIREPGTIRWVCDGGVCGVESYSATMSIHSSDCSQKHAMWQQQVLIDPELMGDTYTSFGPAHIVRERNIDHLRTIVCEELGYTYSAFLSFGRFPRRKSRPIVELDGLSFRILRQRFQVTHYEKERRFQMWCPFSGCEHWIPLLDWRKHATETHNFNGTR